MDHITVKLDWLRRRMGCVSSHEEVDPVYNNMTENNINRFKVTTDESLASDVCILYKRIIRYSLSVPTPNLVEVVVTRYQTPEEGGRRL